MKFNCQSLELLLAGPAPSVNEGMRYETTVQRTNTLLSRCNRMIYNPCNNNFQAEITSP